MHFILSPATCEGTNVGVTILWLLLPTIICIPRLGGVHGNVATVISSLIWQRCSVFLLLLDNTYNGLSELHISLKLCFCSFMMHPCFVVEEEDEENMEKLLQLNNFILMNIRMYPFTFQDYSHHCSISSCCNFVQFYYFHLPLNENCTCSFYCLQLQHLALGKRYCTFNCPSPVGCHLISFATAATRNYHLNLPVIEFLLLPVDTLLKVLLSNHPPESRHFPPR